MSAALAGSLLVACGLGLAVLVRRLGPPQDHWSLPIPFVALSVMVSVAAISAESVAVMMGAGWGDPDIPLVLGLVATALGGLAAIAVALRVAKPSALGLHPPEDPRYWGIGVLGCLGMMALTLLYTTLIQVLGAGVPTQQIMDSLADGNGVEQALLVGYGAFGAPVIEEVLFRGLLVPPLVLRFGLPGAVLASGLLFGMAHVADPVAVFPLAVFGAGLAWLRHRSGSVLPGVLAHVLNNAVALVVSVLG